MRLFHELIVSVQETTSTWQVILDTSASFLQVPKNQVMLWSIAKPACKEVMLVSLRAETAISVI